MKGVYVQAGERGQIFTSEDLGFWIPRESGTLAALRGVAWFGSRIGVTGEAGTVLYADDPARFQWVDLGTTNWLESVAASPARVVAVGDRAAIYWSSNAVDWILAPVAFTNTWLRGVAYGQGRFVAVGEGGFIATSPDGAAWQEEASGTQTHLNRVAWLGARFLAVGDGGLVLGSTGGAAWEPVSAAAPPTLSSPRPGSRTRSWLPGTWNFGCGSRPPGRTNSHLPSSRRRRPGRTTRRCATGWGMSWPANRDSPLPACGPTGQPPGRPLPTLFGAGCGRSRTRRATTWPWAIAARS